MTNDRTTRRGFLKAAKTGAMAGIAITSLVDVQAVFAQEIQNVEHEPKSQDDFAQLRRQYSLDPAVTYLNHASIGTMPIIVQKARAEYLRICETNPWLYMWGGRWEESRELVRQRASELLVCEPSEIAITHNTTEMFNTLANGLTLGKGDEVLFSSLNHDGASVAFEHACPAKGYRVRRFEFPEDQVAHLSSQDVVDIYERQIRPETRLLVLPHIDNTVGLRHPVKNLVAMARSRGVEFVAVDGAQSVGTIPVDMKDLDVDVYATSPHKWLGAPKGIGIAFVSQRIQDKLKAMWVTWGQRRWKGSARVYEDYGTRNLAELLALGDAILFHRQIDPVKRESRLNELWATVKQRAESTAATQFASPELFSNGSPVISIQLEQSDCNDVAANLFQKHGVVVRPFKSATRNAIRVSPNVFTSFEEIEKLFTNL